jgi:hypothetical protein
MLQVSIKIKFWPPLLAGALGSTIRSRKYAGTLASLLGPVSKLALPEPSRKASCFPLPDESSNSHVLMNLGWFMVLKSLLFVQFPLQMSEELLRENTRVPAVPLLRLIRHS